MFKTQTTQPKTARESGEEIALHIDRIADGIEAATERLVRPASKVSRAVEDLAYEARKSFDRITGKAPRRRFFFW